MLQDQLIDEFLSQKRIAIVGVSRANDIPANHIYKKFKSAGYEVYAINPHADEIDGNPCFPSISKLPTIPDAVVLAGTPDVSYSTILECIPFGIKRVWMHRGIGKGSLSAKAANLCEDHGIKVITNGCPMMFVGSVDPFHQLLRWWKRK